MKIVLKTIALSLIAILISTAVNAEKYRGVKSTAKSSSQVQRTGASGCLPGKTSTDLALNNVRARINTGGDMWWDLQGIAEYEIPKGSTKTAMFSASLWMGGLDVNGQLKGAFQRYRGNGNDFWPGPLTIDGTAGVTSEVCAKYDKHFVITKAEVMQFIAYMEDPASFPDYSRPDIISNWPAHGDKTNNYSYYLAPFKDVDFDNEYNPDNGDYPYYDFANTLCKTKTPTMEEEFQNSVHGSVLSDQVLKGDQTLWWVFNDNGNIHSETKGNSIGVEIRAQAFAFSTNDEINNMTFYTYEIINRSTYRLTETYFSQWVDTDLGYSQDDFVGCDVMRGLGYCYNGKAVDGLGKQDHYGAQPPAVGVDFFQGPYMDPDGLDNPKFFIDSNDVPHNCNEAVNGVNFGDGIKDNERFGMRRFVYHNNTGQGNVNLTDPDLAPEYYNFLRGIWKDGTKMKYGGNAHSSGGGNGPECDFMFPGDTDPCNWGTNGVAPSIDLWTEEHPFGTTSSQQNTPYDRRFMQSAGPFTLESGAVNYITVGIPFARASSGGPWASVKLLQKVDDKCQALFDNCFKVLDGPDAPDMTIQELDREVIIYLTNPKSSNNYNEKYSEEDVTITALGYSKDSASYKFQGYQIFQLVDNETSVAEVYDLDKARLVAQCDIADGVTRIVNFTWNDDVNGNIPQIMVEGSNSGIRHSFKISEDQFATGDKRLVNHKKYYYVALAYSYNNFLTYSQDPTVVNGLYGQKKPFLAGRKAALGPIAVKTAIPHISNPENGGTQMNSSFGSSPKIIRLDGQGNGGNILELTKESENKILELTSYDTPEYEAGGSPVQVKVVDPLNVKPGTYRLQFVSFFDTLNHYVSGKTVDAGGDTATYSTGEWIMINTNTQDTFFGDMAINANNEQLFLDLGISVYMNSIYNCKLYQVGVNSLKDTADHVISTDDIYSKLSKSGGLLTYSITYKDSSRMWLSGVADYDGNTLVPQLNWIRSGSSIIKGADGKIDVVKSDYHKFNTVETPGAFYDEAENFENLLGGFIAPYFLASDEDFSPARTHSFSSLDLLQSVNIVLTSDQSKWTRCPVIESGNDYTISEGGRRKMYLRAHASVDKNGQYAATGSGGSSNIADANYIAETGMGWFPGYAINVETGERLNMMFGESSWLKSEKGDDMLFNPTSEYFSVNGDVLFGGKHFVYIFTTSSTMPAYDAGLTIYNLLSNNNFSPGPAKMQVVEKNIMYCGIPMAMPGQTWLSNDVTLKIRIAKPYATKRFANPTNTGGIADTNKAHMPMYQFSLDGLATKVGVNTIAKDALDIIRVVPNPYYAYAAYETTQIDNRVRITNLPETCTIKIYSTDGTLVRYLSKDNNLSYTDWDLKNAANIPIASGIYYIHVDAPGIGEKVIKWFGIMRPIDLNAF